MGFFSWKTSDTKKSIPNMYSNKETFPVYLIKPDGSYIEEKKYKGYGIFGGKDVYALLAKWNTPEECTGDVEHDRMVGIELRFRRKKEIKFPIIILEKKPTKKVDINEFTRSEDCPEQGYFYANDNLDYVQ